MQGIVGRVVLELYDWSSGQCVASQYYGVLVPISGSVEVLQISIASLINTHCSSRSACFVVLTASNSSGEQLSQNVFFLSNLTDVELPQANVTVVIGEQEGRNTSLQVSTDLPAAYVFLSTPIPGRFSDNSLQVVLPNQPVMLQFYGWRDYTLQELQQSISLRHIRLTYV